MRHFRLPTLRSIRNFLLALALIVTFGAATAASASAVDPPTLSITKTPDAQNINAGEDVVFTIQVGNTGPGVAENVNLSDTLPGPVAGAWVAEDPDCSITSGNLLGCTFGDMAAGDTKRVTVRAPTDFDNCGTYDNTAEAIADFMEDPVQDDGEVTCLKPGLTVTKTPDAQKINAGEDVVFTIQVDNAGPGTANGVKLDDTLPTGVVGDTWVEDPDNAECTITGGNQLDCDFGTMGAGAPKTVTVKAATDGDNCTTYNNTATASSSNAPSDSDDGQVTCKNGDLTVTKGGDRSASNSSSGATTYADPVQGARFEYTTDNTLPQGGWVDFTDLTDANGQATENLAAGTYFVREKTPPATDFNTFGPVQTLTFDPSSSSPTAPEPYVARVTIEDGQTTYAYPHSNNSGNPDNWTPTRSGSGPIGESTDDGSPFLNVRNNGVSPAVCGTNILLVLDRSGSIAPNRASYEAAAKAFVDNLNGTPVQIGIISFDDEINSYDPATGDTDYSNAPLDLSVAGNAALLNATITDIYNKETLNGSTNWDGALKAAALAKMFAVNAITGQSTNPDEVVFITDGNPTVNDTDQGGSGNTVSLFNLTAGMASANLVKNQDGRPLVPGPGDRKVQMLAIGVDNEAGSAPTAANLKVVSGPVEGVEGDYATPTITQLNSFLAGLAATECGARVFVRKHLTTDPTNQPDWLYTATDPRVGQTPTYLDGDNSTHDRGGVIETGAIFQALPTTPTTVNVNEDATGQPLADGTFDLTDVDCRSGSYDGAPFPGGVQSGLDYSLPVNRGDEVYCTYTNSPPTTLEVTKTPNDQTINAGDPAEFTIAVENTGSNTAVNATLSDQLPPPGASAWTVSQQPDNGSCSVDGSNLLTCNFGNIAAGATETLKVKTTTSFAKCDVYDNPIATADADNADPASDAGKITCEKPNLSIDKTPDAQNINAGEDVVFTVDVDNAGPGTAKAVKLS
ncbi:MAG: DUF11 domain-containing protein, partial [Thermoleophilia bacterium]|nr:DUF11 domain-containing protein [Thermoleophilia bacterium]